MRRIRVIVVALAVAVGASGCVWPEFRFGPERTGSTPFEGLIGPDNVGRLAPAWTVSTGQTSIGDPVVWGDRVVINAGPRLFAYTRAGAQAWSVDFEGGPVADPAIAAGSVWDGASSGQAGLAKLDLVTSAPTIIAPPPTWEVGSVAFAGSLAYVPVQLPTAPTCFVAQRTFVALDAGSASLQFVGDCSGEGMPTVGGGHLYTSSVAGIEAFDASGTTPCRIDDTIHVKVCAPLWRSTPAGTMTTIAYTPSALFVGSNDGHLYAFDSAGCAASPCAPLWTAATGGPIESSVAVANGVVSVVSDDGKPYAIDANGCGAMTCAPSWSVATSGPVRSSPAVANGVVYVGSDDGKLYGIDANGCGAATCAPLWTSTAGAPVRSSPAVALGSVYVGRDDATLTAYRVP